jgi:hypothetical protein
MTTPGTLKELIAQENHYGFRLAMGHYAELKHGLMGTFPAIESKSGNMIMTTDLELLKQVCATLPARQFRFGAQLIYVNIESGVAYPVLDTYEQSLERSKPFKTFTRERFEELSKMECPFRWTPGLVSNDMSAEDFADTLRAAVV